MKSRLLKFGAVILTVGVLLLLNLAETHLEARSYHLGYPLRILMLTGIAIIVAVSLNLVNGLTGQFSLGHAAFYGIGAYAGAALTVFAQKALFGHILSSDETISWWHGGAVLLLAMLLGGLVSAAFGFLVGLPSAKLRGDYLAIVTLGFNMIVIVVMNAQNRLGGAAGFQGYYNSDTLVGIPQLTSFFWIFAVAVCAIVFSINLRRSVHGLAFESIREDEIAAEAMGIPTAKYKVIAFTIAAFIAGVAGVLYAHYDQTISPANLSFQNSVNFVVMVVLGGLGSVSGSVVGAIILTVLPEALRIEPNLRLVIYSLALVILMLVRPQGIFGRGELDRNWITKQRIGILTMPNRTMMWFQATAARLRRKGANA